MGIDAFPSYSVEEKEDMKLPVNKKLDEIGDISDVIIKSAENLGFLKNTAAGEQIHTLLDGLGNALSAGFEGISKVYENFLDKEENGELEALSQFGFGGVMGAVERILGDHEKNETTLLTLSDRLNIKHLSGYTIDEKWKTSIASFMNNVKETQGDKIVDKNDSLSNAWGVDTSKNTMLASFDQISVSSLNAALKAGLSDSKNPIVLNPLLIKTIAPSLVEEDEDKNLTVKSPLSKDQVAVLSKRTLNFLHTDKYIRLLANDYLNDGGKHSAAERFYLTFISALTGSDDKAMRLGLYGMIDGDGEKQVVEVEVDKGRESVAGSVDDSNILDTTILMPASTFSLSNNGFEHIRSKEGFRGTAYRDSGGVLTIGYGTTQIAGVAVHEGDTITKVLAEELLQKQVEENYSVHVKKQVQVKISQNMFDALVSFCYNCGQGSLQIITNILNTGDYLGAAEKMTEFVNAKKRDKNGNIMKDDNGNTVMVQLDGLITRREEEKNMFLEGYDETALA